MCGFSYTHAGQKNQSSLVGIKKKLRSGLDRLGICTPPTGLHRVKTVSFTLIMAENVRMLQIRTTSMLMLSESGN